MRCGPLVLLLLLAGCGHTASSLSALQPGVDVAQAALRGGSPQTALQLAGSVLARSPGNEAALVVQGDALTELGRLDEARASYSQALRSNPDSVGAEVGSGRIRLTDDPAAAEALFLKAVQHDPRNTAALNDLGVARDLQGNHAGAQEAYRQVLGIDPEDSAAEVNLALSMAMSGSAKDAVRMLRPIASAPGASRKLRHDLAAALVMAGDRDEAASILGKDLSPGEVQQALNDYAAAQSGGAGVSLAATPHGVEAAVALAPPQAPAGRMQVQAPVERTQVQPVALTPSQAPVGRMQAQAPAGQTQVQFAALPTETSAQAEWQRLQVKMPVLLSGRQPVFTKVERNGHTFWRVRTGGFADVADAEAFCQKVQAAAGACSIGGP